MHRLTDAPAVGYAVVEPPPRFAGKPLPLDRLDAIARALVDSLSLLPHHREDLRGRGFTEEEILGRGYRSFPFKTRSAAALRLTGLFREDELLRFPGFLMKRGRYEPYLWLGGAEGLLVPVRDAEGHIVAFRIRPDRRGEGGKYRWLSSSAHGGPSPGTPLHVTRPLCANVAFDAGTVWITEGELKADLSANRLGAVVVSVPGVSIRAGVVEALRSLERNAPPKRVVLAFDADKATKPQVLSAELALARDLREAGFEVQSATWPIEGGKGVDDFLAAGGRPAIAPYPFPRDAHPAARRLEAVPPEWVEARLPKPPAAVPIDEARSLVRTTIDRRLRECAPGLLVIQGTPGVGKTTIAIDALQRAVGEGTLDGRRVLVSMERLDLIEEVLAREEFAELRHVAAVRYGRTDGEASPGHCADIATTNALARRRQGVMRSYCVAEGEGRCPFSAGCAYLSQLRRAEKAQIVFAATALLKTEASEIDDFDVIIVDEALDTALVETLPVTREDIDLWRAAGQGRGGEAGSPVGPASRTISPFLRTLAYTLAESPPEGPRTPLSPVFEAAAGLVGVDARDTVRAVLSIRADRSGRLPCEVPEREGKGGQTSKLASPVPLRALREVAQVLDAELSRPPSADARAWLVRSADGAPSMEFRVPRRRLIERLSRATTINLDATPNVPLLKLAFPAVEVLSLSVPERFEVVQLVDALYVSDTVERHAAALGEIIAHQFEGAALPAVFCEKRFRPDLAANDGKGGVLSVPRKGGAPPIVWGHYGGNSRGTNALSDRDALAIVGHFVPPIDEVEADVRALRFADVPPPQGVEEVLVPYPGRTADGQARARWVRRHADPDVARVIDDRRAAMVRQVIGRTRPSLRGPEEPPVRVLLAAGWPIPDLPVVRLATRAELLGIPAEPSAVKSEAARRALSEANARREEQLRSQVQDALDALQERGEEITASAVARGTGGGGTGGNRRTRIADHLAALTESHQGGVSPPLCSVLSKRIGGDTPSHWWRIVSPCSGSRRPPKRGGSWTWRGADLVRGSGSWQFARTWLGPP